MVPLYGFLNHRMVPLYGFLNHRMVPLYGFLNHRMVPLYGFLNHRMVPLYGFSIIIWFHYMVSQSSYGSIIWFLNHHMVPLYGFSIKKMVSQKMVFSKNLVNYMFPNQTSAFSRYPATDSSKCASTTDSICFSAIIECITSSDSSVWFKLIVYKVKYSICCFKTLRYLLLTIFVCLTIYLFFFSIFLMVFSNGILSTNKYWYFFMLLVASLIIWFTSRKLSLSSFSTSLFFLATTLTKCELNLFEHNLITSLKLSSKSLSSEFDDIL